MVEVRAYAGKSWLLAVGAMIGSAACWGLATVMSKSVLDDIPPFSLLAIQLSASVAFLWAMVLAFNHRPPLNSSGLKAASTGLLEPGLAYGVGVPGLALTTASNASVLGAAEPIFILLIGWAFLRQRPRPAVIVAMAAAMIGVMMVTSADLSGLGQGELEGDVLILLGTAIAAIYVVVSSRLVASFYPLPLAAMQQSAGLLLAYALAAAVALLGFEAVPQGLPASTLAFAAFTGIVQYALAFWLYLLGVRVLPVGVAGLFLTLIPVFGMGGAMVFLGERASAMQLTGAALIIAALVVAARSRG